MTFIHDEWQSIGISLFLNFMLLVMMAAMSLERKPVELGMESFHISMVQLPHREKPLLPQKEPVKKRVKKKTPPPPEEVPSETETARILDKHPEETAGEEGEPVPLHKLTNMPGFARRVEPVYPETERIYNREGKVLVEVTISAQGAVMDVKVLSAETERFADAVVKAVMASTFFPGYIAGKPVPVKFQIPFSFKLN